MKRLLIVTCFLVNSFAGAAEVPRKPNVLLFLADFNGDGHLGIFVVLLIETPRRAPADTDSDGVVTAQGAKVEIELTLKGKVQPRGYEVWGLIDGKWFYRETTK